MYSDVLDINFGQQCHIVQFVKEDCSCFELLFGNELQSLIAGAAVSESRTSYWLLRLKLSRVELYFHVVCKTGGNFVI